MTTTEQTALQLAARKLVEAQEQTAELSRILGTEAAETIVTRPDGTSSVALDTTLLSQTLNALGQALEAAGATYQPTDRPGASASFQAPASDPHGLEALRKIEGSRREAQALLQVLGVALDCAEDLDKKRGDWVGDMAHTDKGETPGTGYSEMVQALILKLQGELGVEGSGRE